MMAVNEAAAGGSPPQQTFHSPDPVTPVQNPREITPISPARKLVLPVVTTSPTRPRGSAATRSRSPAPAIATPESLGERELAIARVVATRWLFVSRRRLAPCVPRVNRIADSQLCSQLATCCWWAWAELRRDAQVQRVRNSIAFKHVARSMVSRYLREWRYAVQLRFWLQYANTVALRHWAYFRQLHGWRAWRWTIQAENHVLATRAKRASSMLWRSLQAWAECTPFVARMGRGQTSSPSLVEWAFCAKYRDTRQLAISVDTWTTHTRCRRRLKLQMAKSWQHRQYAMLVRSIRAWESYTDASKQLKTSYRKAVAFRRKRVLASWVDAKRQRYIALETKVHSHRLNRVRAHMYRWQCGIENQRADDTARRMFKTNLQNALFSRWRRATTFAAALRAMDEVATGVALSRLARKTIDGWVMWRSIQLKKATICRAADGHYRNGLAANTFVCWRLFVGHRVKLCRLRRQAWQHRRSRTMRRAFGTWLCYHARLNKEYAALQLALQNRQRSNVRAAFAGWQCFKAASRARRLQFLHAQGFREEFLTAGILRTWCESISEIRRMRSLFTAACKHADVKAQGFVMHAWSQAAQLSATLRWAKQSRLSSLCTSLGVGKLRRSWHVWAVDFVAAVRAKAAQQCRAIGYLKMRRLRACMTMLGAFVAQRRWAHRKWSAAVHKHGATLLAFALASMVKYGKLSLQAQALRSAAVRHSHAQLLRGSLGSWRKYVAKRRVKAAAETAALASYRARLLLHGCRRWLAGGLGRRTARVESVLVAERNRATALMATVERLARHWRNKTLERSSKRQLIPGPHRGHHVASSGRSTDSVIASLQMSPVVSTVVYPLTETTLHPKTAATAVTSASALAPRVRPAPRRPTLLFGAAPTQNAYVNGNNTFRESAVAKLQQHPQAQPQPQTSCSQQLRSSPKTTTAVPQPAPSIDGFAEREGGLAKMEAVLSGYQELKQLRQRARAALQSATDKYEAVGEDKTGLAWRHCCEEVEELRAQVQDLDRRCAEQVPAVRAVAARLQELRALP